MVIYRLDLLNGLQEDHQSQHVGAGFRTLFHPAEEQSGSRLAKDSPARLRLPRMTRMAELKYTSDTSQESLEVQLACRRRMSSRERMRQTLVMSRRMRNMAMDAIRRRHPELGDAEVGLMFIELTYGKSLADDVRRWRAERET